MGLEANDRTCLIDVDFPLDVGRVEGAADMELAGQCLPANEGLMRPHGFQHLFGARDAQSDPRRVLVAGLFSEPLDPMDQLPCHAFPA